MQSKRGLQSEGRILEGGEQSSEAVRAPGGIPTILYLSRRTGHGRYLGIVSLYKNVQRKGGGVLLIVWPSLSFLS